MPLYLLLTAHGDRGIFCGQVVGSIFSRNIDSTRFFLNRVRNRGLRHVKSMNCPKSKDTCFCLWTRIDPPQIYEEEGESWSFLSS